MTRLVPGLGLAAGLTATLFLSGCGGGGEEAQAFRPLSYSYLTPLRLNVGGIRIEDHVPPPAGPDLAQEAPVPPEEALRRMAQDRLVAAGSSGTAVFSIDQAAVTGEPGGPLDGTLAVHLDIIGNNGGHSGYAEAHVSRQFVPGAGTDNDGLRSELYNLTVQMMQDMNVEFEYQLRRTLSDWMVDASGAPVAASVEQQPLTTPGQNALPAPPSVGAPLQLAPPSDTPAGAAQGSGFGPAPAGPAPAGPSATDPAAGTPLQLSPQPGFLQPPSGTASAAPASPNGAGPGYPGQAYPGQAYPAQSSPVPGDAGRAYPDRTTYPGQTYPGQTYPNQTYPSQTYPSQTYPGQAYPGPGQPGQVDPGAAPQGE